MTAQTVKHLIVAVFLLQVFLFSASCRYSPEVRRALRLAGDNREAFEAILRYYSRYPADSLKLKAAIFLIENMPGHYSYSEVQWQEKYYSEIEAIVNPLQTTAWHKEMIEKISAKYVEQSRKTSPDLCILTAPHLVDHIERSFEVWQNGEWASHVSFEDFCEYILPYKGNEMQFVDNNCIPIQRIGTLAKLPFGSCDNYALLSVGVMRSKGIPVAIDFTPQWPFRSQGHTWTVVLTNQGKNVEFPAGFSNPGEPHKPDEKKAKVFRKSYAINRELETLNKKAGYAPAPFNSTFIKDVTEEYITTEDVILSVPYKYRKYRYAYLAVFDNEKWVAVHYGKMKNGKVLFSKMGKNCLYMPVCFDGKKLIPFSSPFLLTFQGAVKPVVADKKQTQTMTLYRKYYIGTHCYDVAHRLLGGKFQAANTEDFSDAITFHRVNHFTTQSQEIRLDTVTTAYRYWRYVSAENQNCNIAEIYFYRENSPEAIYGQVIGTEGSAIADNAQYSRTAVFDRDPLTFFEAPDPSDAWAGMDFGEPVRINKIGYTPRGDGNDVTPGDTHELLYWDNNQWISLGKQIACEPVLRYENAPANALFWLRNLSRGHEERIFTYENGEHIWW
jgi:hypothetical protein